MQLGPLASIRSFTVYALYCVQAVMRRRTHGSQKLLVTLIVRWIVIATMNKSRLSGMLWLVDRLWVMCLLCLYLWTGCDEKENSRESKAASDTNSEVDCHRYDEQVNVCLECCDADMSPLPRKYLRSAVDIFHSITYTPVYSKHIQSVVYYLLSIKM